MVETTLTPSLRWHVLGVAVGTAAVGASLAWLGFGALLPPLRAMRDGAALIAYPPYDVIALPLALTCLALSAMASLPLVGKRAGKPSAKGKLPNPRSASVLFGLAVAGALLTIIISPIAQAVMVRIMADHGYSVCPAGSNYERHPPVRFVDAAGRCP